MYKIQNILSTDTVRNKMRERIDKEQNPIIHASTFETGDHLPKADYKRIKNCLKINQSSSVKAPIDMELFKEMAWVKGYEYQWEMIEESLISEIDKIWQSSQSLVVEGVHLSESVCSKLFDKYIYCIPFIIHVKDADEHMKRFGSRCEDGSIDPSKNRYVKNFRYIRAIQKSIKKKPIYSRYSKIANDDAKKTLGVVSTWIRKYIK
jgi:2-phosphoglycerate kinase